jgi:hypothetical protein
MMLRNRFLLRFLAAFTVLALLLSAHLVRTAAQQAGKGQERLIYDEKTYKDKSKDIRGMLQGDMSADKKLLDLAAQHFAYRLTMTDLQNKKGMMPQLVKDAIGELDFNRKDDRKTNEALPIFNKAMVAHLKEVLPNPRPIASVNAAMVLAYMGKLGIEEAMDPLAEALSDPEMNGATKFWAAQGLHDFFQLAFPAGEEQPIVFKDKEREARCIMALLGALDIKLPQSPPPSAEEMEGLRYLRREIIRALGVSRYPAVLEGKGAIKGPTALALIRIIRNDSMNPTPRLDEQVEAAAGLAMLKMAPTKDYKPQNEYQLDVAAYHLGRFVVDLASAHQNKGTEKKTAQDRPWKTFGAHLSVAMGAMKNEAAYLRKKVDPKKYGKVAEYVTQIVDLSAPILKGIENDGTALPDKLATVLEQTPRDADPIYKGDANAVIKPGAAAIVADPAKEKTGKEDKPVKDKSGKDDEPVKGKPAKDGKK